MRFVALAALLLLTSGCMGLGGPVELPPVSEGDRAREAPNDCKAFTVDTGSSHVARIRCSEGTGIVQATVQGCTEAPQPSWLSVETAPGKYGEGSATATVTSGERELGKIRLVAAEDEGRESTVVSRPEYVLTMELDGWADKWVIATVACEKA